MPSPWKFLFDSVAGASHSETSERCQDYANGRSIEVHGDPVLILVCADGAGSALHSAFGSKLACIGLLSTIASAFEDGLTITDVTRQHIIQWHTQVRGRLSLEACRDGNELRDYACTLLTAIVGPERAIFSQIGDGVIVYRDGSNYLTPCWPQQGEYANITYFLTNQDFDERLAFHTVDGQVDELALLTDGLQSLALHYASRTVHAPFFLPMFKSLRSVSDSEELAESLRGFLNSTAVNNRTDDDKTLVLATRHPLQDDQTL